MSALPLNLYRDISSQGHDSMHEAHIAMFTLLEMLDHIESEIAFF
jgi:hypothetical protein